MTVLQSLLSKFRRSRSIARKPRRTQALSAQQSSSSCESLEQRLLLTNPLLRDSLLGAPVTIYLDFDGHTENHVEWGKQATGGGPIVTPAFSFDADGNNFTQAERDSIEEIWERVAEDFRPFNVNVTTVLPNRPAGFVNAFDMLVSIGGNGSWDSQNNRFNAITNSFSVANQPQTAFAFQTPHSGLNSEFEQNIAASVSQTIAVAMGLEIHRPSQNSAPLEGDGLIAPILGDQIVGLDQNPNPNSQRDIWFNARGTTSAIQDDLAELIANNPQVNYRLDDVGDTDVDSTGIPVLLGTEVVSGVIETNDDVDVFTFTTAATIINIDVTTLDLRARFNAATPGSNLDPVVTLRDESGQVLQVVGVQDNALNANINQLVRSGTYYLEVSNRGEYGNLGRYTVTISGVDNLPSFSNPIALGSKPNAPVSVYLAFNGGFLPDGSPLLGSRAFGIGQRGFPAYDSDGDQFTFSQTELDEMAQIWARVAEDFAPFDVNVTTVRPPNLNDREAMQIIIGGGGEIYGDPTSPGVSLLNAFSVSQSPNIGLIFAQNIQQGAASDAQHIAFRVSANAARMLGLDRHPEYDASGVETNPEDPGTIELGPIMGAPLGSLRDTWSNAPDSTSSQNFQNDLNIITDPVVNGITFRVDDHGNSIPFATIMSIGPGDDQISGIIEMNDDVDVFRFNTLDAMAVITVRGLDLTAQYPGVTNPGSNLDPVLELLDGTGAVLATHDANPANGNPSSLSATISQNLLAGTYYIRVSNRAEYGNLGEYTVTVQGVDGDPVTVEIDPNTFSEIDGVQTGVGKVLRPAGQSFGSPIFVELSSSDTSELTVPPSVTIPAGAASVDFDVTIVDDDFLDGDQRVSVRTVVNGVINGTAFVTVTDYETVSVDVLTNPVAEDAGTVAVTITRSNVDIDAPNHWVTVDNQLLEYSPTGNLINTIPIEWPAGARPQGENAHDVIVLEDGRIAIYNGGVNAALSIFNPNNGIWDHIGPIAGLSGSPTDGSVGGIASSGNFIFLTDFESFNGDTHVMVRIDITNGQLTRFGEGTLGSRLFSMVGGLPQIHEFNAADGSLIDTLDIAITQTEQIGAVAFDGISLWVLVNSSKLLKVDPDTGETLEEHPLLGTLNNGRIDGIAAMNGLIYLSTQNGAATNATLEIEEYDPSTRRTTGRLITPDNAFTSRDFGQFIGAIPNADRLLVTTESFVDTTSTIIIGNFTFTTTTRSYGPTSIGLVDPTSGLVTGNIIPPNTTPLGRNRGITSVGDIAFGPAVYNDLIYVSRSLNTIDVYTQNGIPVDTDPSTPVIDPLTTAISHTGGLAGGDVPGVEFGDLRFRDVTIGFDGLIYGLIDTGNQISVHDPGTLSRIRGINLDRSVTAIAVGDDSGIYAGGANGIVIQFDLNGITQSVLNTSLGQISDIEVNIGQEVLISDVAGDVILTTQEAINTGNAALITPLEGVGGVSFVSFGRHPTRSTGNLAVTLTSSDISELTVPVTVIIPRGQQSITFDIDVVDDNERDGDQQVTVIADSPEYVAGSNLVTVTDVENVAVDILPAEVSEGSGVIPGIVRVYRTDVDGPYNFASTITQANTTAVPIADNAVTISQIVLEDQISRITDVNITLSIEHDAIPDLDVFLLSPQGTRVQLFSDLSSNESNLTSTTLDDQARVRIVDAAAPFTGLYIPEEFLADFTGENPSGAWSLEIIDDSVTDAGILLSWSLEIATVGLEELTVTLSSDDTTEAKVPQTVTIPHNQFEVFQPLEVVDDDELDGDQPVTVSVDTIGDANGSSVTGFTLISDTVNVVDSEVLTIVLNRAAVSEGAGLAAITGTISRLNTTGALTITLTTSDATELSVPSTVTIPDGSTFVTFTADAVDDSDFDGDQQVTIIAITPGYLDAVSEIITVQDQEPQLQLSTLTPVFAEDAGTIMFIVTRRDAIDLSVAQLVTLTSNDETELTVPQTVIINPGELSASFFATVIEDTDLDGTRVVTITATDINVANPVVNSTTFNVSVLDAESVAITVPAGQESILENAGNAAVTVTVSISSVGHTAPIIVSLANSDLTELSIPATVVIPVGSNSTTFLLDVLNDPQIDRDQLVRLTGSVDGYRDGILDITVRDHEPPVLVGPALDTLDPTPTFAWAAVDGATRYDLWVNDVSRNINQLFRRENERATPALFKETFEAQGGFDEAGWTSTNAEVDGLGINVNGAASAHLNGNPAGGDQLESRTINLSGEVGAQLTYSYQRTGTLESPGPGQDLVLQYRNADGSWIQLERQLGVEEDMTVFKTSVVTLPQAALHANFAFRFINFGDPDVEVPDGQEVTTTVDDWFVDDIILAGFETFEPEQELGVGRYRFWVRAYDDLEQPGAWSVDRNFLVRTKPVFTSPVTSVTLAETTFPQISWESVVDTDRYDLWINNVTTGDSQVVRETGLQTTSFASSTANLPGGTYRAWVRAIAPDLDPNDRIDAIAGQWSSPIVFTVLSIPQNISPSGATFDRTPEIRWDAVEGATNYDVWVTQRRGPGDSPIALRDQFVVGTSRIPETDFATGSYVVWVRAIAEDGSRSQWSAPVGFTIGGRPVVNSPANGAATSSRPVVAWTGIEQAAFYEIWVNNSLGDRVVFESNIQATSFAIATALPANSYRVWVRAVSEMGETSLWSNPVSFTVVAATVPAAEDNVRPSSETTIMLTRFSAVDQKARLVADESVTPKPVVDESVISEFVALESAAVESTNEASEAVDSVMADWDGANWWDSNTAESSEEESPVTAAALGFIALGATGRSTIRRRSSKR